MVAVVKSSRGGKKRRGKLLAKSERWFLFHPSRWVAGGMGMEGRLVRRLIMEEVEPLSAPDGDERGRGGGVYSTASLIALSERKDNLRLGIHYLFLQRG